MNSIEIIGTPIKIDNLEIAQNDFPSDMVWIEALKICEALGDSWRLPTIDEWTKTLHSNRFLIGVIEKYELLPNVYPPTPRTYWSSTNLDQSINYWNFSYGKQTSKNQFSKHYVRAVRTF